MHDISRVFWLKPKFNFYCHFSKNKLTQSLDRTELYTCVVLVSNHNHNVTCIVPCSAGFCTVCPDKILNNLHTKISKITWSDFPGICSSRSVTNLPTVMKHLIRFFTKDEDHEKKKVNCFKQSTLKIYTLHHNFGKFTCAGFYLSPFTST